MRPRNEVARVQLKAVLSRRSAVTAAEIALALDVSVPTLHRLLAELGDEVITTGKARRTRYALRRAMRGFVGDLPVYEVDANGRASLLSKLALVSPYGSCMQLASKDWPLPDESRDGWFDGLPYPLYDMRPQGYMGRQFARAQARPLEVAANPDQWSDDDVVHVMSRAGSDLSGNLIVGDAAFEKWQEGKVSPAEPLSTRSLPRAYARMAESAISEGAAGSSAGGEFPKFSSMRDLGGSATPHVLVKFSGADDSAAVRRWSDLLVCEHLALDCAATMPGVRSSSTRVVTHEGRTFLEVERFDRHGMFGRSRLSSLAMLDAALLGDGSTDWTRIAERLSEVDLVSDADLERIRHLWWFGRLIANTDMHNGNLSFEPHSRLALAPAYDMLPMSYAPLPGGELPKRNFAPPLPLPPQRDVWSTACIAALSFWDRAATDVRITAEFRGVCASNAVHLRKVADRV